MNEQLDRLTQIVEELAGDAAVHSSHATRQAKAQQAYAVIEELRSEKAEPARSQSPVERKVEEMLALDVATVGADCYKFVPTLDVAKDVPAPAFIQESEAAQESVARTFQVEDFEPSSRSRKRK